MGILVSNVGESVRQAWRAERGEAEDFSLLK
jgi:hypothetical protein